MVLNWDRNNNGNKAKKKKTRDEAQTCDITPRRQVKEHELSRLCGVICEKEML